MPFTSSETHQEPIIPFVTSLCNYIFFVVAYGMTQTMPKYVTHPQRLQKTKTKLFSILRIKEKHKEPFLPFVTALWWCWWLLFPSLVRILAECSNVHSQPAFLLLLFFLSFFLEVEINSRTLIPLFMSGSVHSGPESCDDRGRMFPDKLRMISFPDRFLHYTWTAV